MAGALWQRGAYGVAVRSRSGGGSGASCCAPCRRRARHRCAMRAAASRGRQFFFAGACGRDGGAACVRSSSSRKFSPCRWSTRSACFRGSTVTTSPVRWTPQPHEVRKCTASEGQEGQGGRHGTPAMLVVSGTGGPRNVYKCVSQHVAYSAVKHVVYLF